MSVEAVKDVPEVIRIDLKSINTFKEIKGELEKQFKSAHEMKIGTQVSIDIGSRKLSSKQIREIEDIMLDYGMHLKELIGDELPVNHFNSDNYQNSTIWNEVSYYEDTALICRHLRSGQKLFSDGNIVILGDINPGAEVIAGGSILVMGVLRGMAHAGAFGDEKTVIAAYRLNPTQLRIANHITRPPDGEAIMVNNPELARIRAGKVIIEKLKI